MEHRKEINELIKLTEDFAAEVLAPKVAEVWDDPDDFASGIGAALMTVGHCAKTGFTKYVKKGDRYYHLDRGEKLPDDEPEKKPEKDEEDVDSFADEMSDLIEKILKTSKKHAKGDKADFNASIASSILSLLKFGGPSVLTAVMIGIEGIATGKVEF